MLARNRNSKPYATWVLLIIFYSTGIFLIFAILAPFLLVRVVVARLALWSFSLLELLKSTPSSMICFLKDLLVKAGLKKLN